MATTSGKENSREPATMVRLHLKKLGQVVDGDATIEDPSTSASSTSVSAPTGTPPPPPPGKLKRPGEDAAWPIEYNKRNKRLCVELQNDSCYPCAKGTIACPMDPNARHQCAKCLGDHPAIRCNGSGMSPFGVHSPSAGGGGAGGGGGGKGGKGAGKGGKPGKKKNKGGNNWQGGWNN